MLIYPGVTPLDAIGPLQVFDLANIVRRQTLYEIVTVAPDAEPVPTSCGFAFMSARTLANLELPVDTWQVAAARKAWCSPISSNGCAPTAIRRGASAPFALAPLLWALPGYWMAGGPRHTGRRAPS
jgi:transcriptional regulator GlxA family with amidase domain